MVIVEPMDVSDIGSVAVVTDPTADTDRYTGSDVRSSTIDRRESAPRPASRSTCGHPAPVEGFSRPPPPSTAAVLAGLSVRMFPGAVPKPARHLHRHPVGDHATSPPRQPQRPSRALFEQDRLARSALRAGRTGAVYHLDVFDMTEPASQTVGPWTLHQPLGRGGNARSGKRRVRGQ